MTQDETNKADESKSLQGLSPDVSDEVTLLEYLEEALDYRGDVTLKLDADEELQGYIFDRFTGQGLDDSYIRVMPAGSDEKRKIYYREIKGLTFSGRDAAHGKSWETWLKKWAEKKAKGEAANIYADPLDD